jgi:SNF2 family DNA or RNA helicase
MERWQNQEEAYKFAMSRPAAMLAMDMGTGKTRVAIDIAMDRSNVWRVLVVCPKAVVSVWPKELSKHADNRWWSCYTRQPGKISDEAKRVKDFITPRGVPGVKRFVVINYDSVWRKELGEAILKAGFDMVVLDESHRAKAAGSKVSRFLALLGKRVKYRLCLSGTPMANSPLDVYGQYRFLDPSIYGTNHNAFMQEYAVMGGPERRFVVGYKNQRQLNEKFRSIAYQCSMADVSQRLKLPEQLPPTTREVGLPAKDMRTLRELSKEFVAECSTGNTIVVNNVLTRALRMQQIAAGFCLTVSEPGAPAEAEDLNTAKADALLDYLEDIGPQEKVVVFCQFKHDLNEIGVVAHKAGRDSYELSGACNELEAWKTSVGGVLAVQIQAGAEGVDMTCSNHAVYFTLPYSLALYDQSKARLYRPGQTHPVSFVHLIAEGTIDELIYQSLMRKRSLIDAVKEGTLDYGILKK